MSLSMDEVLFALNNASSGGTTNYSALTNKPKINNVELSGNKSTSDLGLLGVADIGKGISLGFDGTLANNVLTFENPLGEPYDIKENYDYEIDLNFAAAGTLDDAVEVEIENDGEMIQFWTINHNNVTTSATVGDLKAMSSYDVDSGFRWLFKARCRITSSGVKAFIIYPTIVNLSAALNFKKTADGYVQFTL